MLDNPPGLHSHLRKLKVIDFVMHIAISLNLCHFKIVFTEFQAGNATDC